MTFPRAILIACATLPFVPIIANAQDGWYLFRADARRTGTASKLPAWEKRVAWQRPLLNDKLQGLFGEVHQDQDDAAKELIDKLRKNADPATLPGSFPIIVKNQCVYRSYCDVRSVALQEITVNDEELGLVEKLAASRIVWKSIWHDRSLVIPLSKSQVPGWVKASVETLQKNKQELFLWANPMVGSLSADDERIYAINDFPFPAESSFKKIDDELRDLLRGNVLYAYDSYSGKLLWDTARSNPSNDPAFINGVFLGAPLPLNRRLYVLHEHTGDARERVAGNLRLMSIDPTPKTKGEFWVSTLERTQTLLKVPTAEQIRNHPLRRTQPLHIAHADGLLVCPTHAGVLFGVDRDKLAVRWQYRYRAEKAAAPTLPLWQAACPIIHKDRIVFTAADAPDIHCIDLKGVKQWTKPADNDLYLATVTDDIVLLVGKTHCRALSLADGAVKWKVEMGLPAGVGVKDGSIYYLPLKRDAGTKGPTIWGIDLAKGKKASRVEAPYPDALGNLALHRGMFVSQSVTHIAAFPLVAKKN